MSNFSLIQLVRCLKHFNAYCIDDARCMISTSIEDVISQSNLIQEEEEKMEIHSQSGANRIEMTSSVRTKCYFHSFISFVQSFISEK